MFTFTPRRSSPHPFDGNAWRRVSRALSAPASSVATSSRRLRPRKLRLHVACPARPSPPPAPRPPSTPRRKSSASPSHLPTLEFYALHAGVCAGQLLPGRSASVQLAAGGSLRTRTLLDVTVDGFKRRRLLPFGPRGLTRAGSARPARRCRRAPPTRGTRESSRWTVQASPRCQRALDASGRVGRRCHRPSAAPMNRSPPARPWNTPRGGVRPRLRVAVLVGCAAAAVPGTRRPFGRRPFWIRASWRASPRGLPFYTSSS